MSGGICLEHGGTLVFPTLFAGAPPHEDDTQTLPRPLYYDFNGPIDNIYAALIARLALCGEFGGVRLWSNCAEFEQGGKMFGAARKDRGRGRGHLDIYVSSEADAEKRELFIRTIEQDLTTQGVRVLKGLAFDCSCGMFRFDEDLLRGRLEDGKDNVRCSRCDRRYPLFCSTIEPLEMEKRVSA